MKGDFSRGLFDPGHPPLGVYMQQGRVMLDADWNAMVDAFQHQLRERTRDVFGPAAAIGEGFAVRVGADGSLTLNAGRCYVDGLLVEAAGPHALTPPAESGVHRATLRVWVQTVTAVEDPSLREPALGGPDTTLQSRVCWEVLWTRAPRPSDSLRGWPSHDLDVTTLRKLRRAPPLPPCAARLTWDGSEAEGHLHRVEVYAADDAVTLLWSRFNGALLFEGEAADDGEGAWLVRPAMREPWAGVRLDAGWCEALPLEALLDGSAVLARRGVLCEADPTRDGRDTIRLRVPAGAKLTGEHRYFRWWDGRCVVRRGEVARFDRGPSVELTGAAQPGDRWRVARRHATAGADALLPRERERVHEFVLADVLVESGRASVVADLRRPYVDADASVSLRYLGGAPEDAALGIGEGGPLVSVSLYGYPLRDQMVSFRLVNDDDARPAFALRAEDGKMGRDVIAFSDEVGVAQCRAVACGGGHVLVEARASDEVTGQTRVLRVPIAAPPALWVDAVDIWIAGARGYTAVAGNDVPLASLADTRVRVQKVGALPFELLLFQREYHVLARVQSPDAVASATAEAKLKPFEELTRGDAYIVVRATAIVTRDGTGFARSTEKFFKIVLR